MVQFHCVSLLIHSSSFLSHSETKVPEREKKLGFDVTEAYFYRLRFSATFSETKQLDISRSMGKSLSMHLTFDVREDTENGENQRKGLIL